MRGSHDEAKKTTDIDSGAGEASSLHLPFPAPSNTAPSHTAAEREESITDNDKAAAAQKTATEAAAVALLKSLGYSMTKQNDDKDGVKVDKAKYPF